jgi:uncharacterized protein (TIGR00299 family) protein
MLLGALIDAGLELDALSAELDKLQLSGCSIEAHKVSKQHLACTKFDVIDREEQPLRHLADLTGIVDAAPLDEDVKATANAIFLKIGEAEAKIHDKPLDKVHFHEIGAIDTIVDVVGAVVGLKLLGIERVTCSRLNVGSGTVTFSHGTYPVPAPATAEILKDVPMYTSDSKGELVTPTGAAIISTVAEAFGEMPTMSVDAVGYGAGGRDMETPNALRVYLGESDAGGGDVIRVIETNIDDMNPEIYEYVLEQLMSAGALDAFLTSVSMKKGRPGALLTVLSLPEKEEVLCEIILRETTSIGVRIREERRRKLDRELVEVATEFGPVMVKVSSFRGEVVTRSPEYEDCKRIAHERGVPLKDVYRAAELAAAG